MNTQCQRCGAYDGCSCDGPGISFDEAKRLKAIATLTRARDEAAVAECKAKRAISNCVKMNDLGGAVLFYDETKRAFDLAESALAAAKGGIDV